MREQSDCLKYQCKLKSNIGEWSLQTIVPYTSKMPVYDIIEYGEWVMYSDIACTDRDVIMMSVSISYTTAYLREDALISLKVLSVAAIAKFNKKRSYASDILSRMPFINL